MARAKAKVSRFQSRLCVMGCSHRPKPCRMPMEIVTMAAPHNRTWLMESVLAECDMRGIYRTMPALRPPDPAPSVHFCAHVVLERVQRDGWHGQLTFWCEGDVGGDALELGFSDERDIDDGVNRLGALHGIHQNEGGIVGIRA